MSITFPALHRQKLPPGFDKSSYRKELAEWSTQFVADPESAAARAEKQVVEISSLQSEGLDRRDISDAKQHNCTLEEFQNLQDQLRGDGSALTRLITRDSVIDEECRAVLQDVAAQVKANGGEGEFIFQPRCTTGDMLAARAVHVDAGSGLLQAFDVNLHATPGLDDGLLLVTPSPLREAQDILREFKTGAGISLDHPELGWHFQQ